MHSATYCMQRHAIHPCSKAALANEDHVRELQQQVLLLSEGEAARSSEQQARLGALINSFNKMRETCDHQVGFTRLMHNPG